MRLVLIDEAIQNIDEVVVFLEKKMSKIITKETLEKHINNLNELKQLLNQYENTKNEK